MYQSADERIEEITHVHSGKALGHQKEAILPFRAWIELDIIVANEISRSQKDKYHLGTAIRGNLRMLIPQKLGLLGRVTRVWHGGREGWIHGH